ncbi:hypothetical protein [Paenibacillus planticolens]|uniref:hypothetical protein n=1 Tax=Paenibacillus planticolens TaxID=2654976 RepID=UPI0014927FEE|nr:hypothetical protein [Paenibacillus planticolens]
MKKLKKRPLHSDSGAAVFFLIGGTTGRYSVESSRLGGGEGTRVRYFAILTDIWAMEVE